MASTARSFPYRTSATRIRAERSELENLTSLELLTCCCWMFVAWKVMKHDEPIWMFQPFHGHQVTKPLEQNLYSSWWTCERLFCTIGHTIHNFSEDVLGVFLKSLNVSMFYIFPIFLSCLTVLRGMFVLFLGFPRIFARYFQALSETAWGIWTGWIFEQSRFPRADPWGTAHFYLKFILNLKYICIDTVLHKLVLARPGMFCLIRWSLHNFWIAWNSIDTWTGGRSFLCGFECWLFLAF